MTELTLASAQSIVTVALARARDLKLKPVAVVVIDARGAVKSAAAEDGTSLKRMEVAHGKTNGALGLGLGSRTLYKRANEQPFFIAAVGPLVGSGDSSDNDELAAIAGVVAASFVPDPGSDA